MRAWHRASAWVREDCEGGEKVFPWTNVCLWCLFQHGRESRARQSELSGRDWLTIEGIGLRPPVLPLGRTLCGALLRGLASPGGDGCQQLAANAVAHATGRSYGRVRMQKGTDGWESSASGYRRMAEQTAIVSVEGVAVSDSLTPYNALVI